MENVSLGFKSYGNVNDLHTAIKKMKKELPKGMKIKSVKN